VFDSARYPDPWQMGEPLPPARIGTARLILRCWRRDDAPLLKAALEPSLDHLTTWLRSAADEPSDLHEIASRLERFSSEFSRGVGFAYGIFDASESEVVGGAGLLPRIGPGALEIGYWVRVDLVGRGFATEAADALASAGLGLPQVDRVVIRVDPDNTASVAVARKLRFRYLERRREEVEPGGASRDTLVFERSAPDDSTRA